MPTQSKKQGPKTSKPTETVVKSTEALPGGEQVSYVIEKRDFVTKITFGVEQSIRMGEYESLKPSIFLSTEINASSVSDTVISELRSSAVSNFSEYRKSLIESDRKRVAEAHIDEIEMKLKDAISVLDAHIGTKQANLNTLLKALKNVSELKTELSLYSPERLSKYDEKYTLLYDEVTVITKEHEAKKAQTQAPVTASTTKAEVAKETTDSAEKATAEQKEESITETPATESEKAPEEKPAQNPPQKPTKRGVPTMLDNSARGSARTTTTAPVAPASEKIIASNAPLQMGNAEEILAERSASLGITQDAANAPANPLAGASIFGSNTSPAQPEAEEKVEEKTEESKDNTPIKNTGVELPSDLPY